MGNLIGKHYEATKDYLSWSGFEVKVWTPIILKMGRVWAEYSKKKG